MGGVEAGVSGRETRTKSYVLIAVEERIGKRGPIAGRVGLGRTNGATGAELLEFIQRSVEPAARSAPMAGRHTSGSPNTVTSTLRSPCTSQV